MSSANIVFIFPFSTWISFIYFSCLAALDRTFRAMLNPSVKSEHTCLALDLRGKAQCFTRWYDDNYGCFVDALYQDEMFPSSFRFPEIFLLCKHVFFNFKSM